MGRDADGKRLREYVSVRARKLMLSGKREKFYPFWTRACLSKIARLLFQISCVDG